jgi:hypothetical protein
MDGRPSLVAGPPEQNQRDKGSDSRGDSKREAGPATNGSAQRRSRTHFDPADSQQARYRTRPRFSAETPYYLPRVPDINGKTCLLKESIRLHKPGLPLVLRKRTRPQQGSSSTEAREVNDDTVALPSDRNVLVF